MGKSYVLKSNMSCKVQPNHPYILSYSDHVFHFRMSQSYFHVFFSKKKIIIFYVVSVEAKLKFKVFEGNFSY